MKASEESRHPPHSPSTTRRYHGEQVLLHKSILVTSGESPWRKSLRNPALRRDWKTTSFPQYRTIKDLPLFNISRWINILRIQAPARTENYHATLRDKSGQAPHGTGPSLTLLFYTPLNLNRSAGIRALKQRYQRPKPTCTEPSWTEVISLERNASTLGEILASS